MPAIEAMRHGAYHYISKDFDLEGVRALVANASERQDLNRHVHAAARRGGRAGRPRVRRRPEPRDARCHRARAEVAKLSATVLILGESGTGKELLARLIHRESAPPRRRSWR